MPRKKQPNGQYIVANRECQNRITDKRCRRHKIESCIVTSSIARVWSEGQCGSLAACAAPVTTVRAAAKINFFIIESHLKIQKYKYPMPSCHIPRGSVAVS